MEGNQVEELKTEGRGHKGLIISGIALLIVISVSCIFIFSSHARNSVKRLFMSDEDYFRSVEKEKLSEDLSLVTAFYENNADYFNNISDKGALLSADVNYKAYDGSEQFFNEIGNEEFYSPLGWLKNASLKVVLQNKDKKIDLSSKLSVNSENVFDFDLLTSTDGDNTYFGFPILSDKYAEVSASLTDILLGVMEYIDCDSAHTISEHDAKIISSLLSYINEKGEPLILPEELERIRENYVGMFVDSLTDISVSGKCMLEVSEASVECTKFTVKLTPEIINDFLKRALAQLSIDSDIKTILKRFEQQAAAFDAYTGYGLIYREQLNIYTNIYELFKDGISLALDMLERENPEDIFLNLSYVLYVDSSGFVTGRELYDEDNICLLGYRMAIEDNIFGLECYSDFIPESGLFLDAIEVKGRIENNSLSGNLSRYNEKSRQYEIAFKNFDLKKYKKGELDVTIIQKPEKLAENYIFRNVTLEHRVEFSDGCLAVEGTILDDSDKMGILKLRIDHGYADGDIKQPVETAEFSFDYDIFSFAEDMNYDNMLNNMKAAGIPDEIYEAVYGFSQKPDDFLKRVFINYQ